MRKEINVYGDLVLLKALAEKVLDSGNGWQNLDLDLNETKYIRFYAEECGNKFRYFKTGLNHNSDALIFNLPQDWNAALEAITKKDIPEYIKVTKAGNSVWYKNSIGKIFKVSNIECGNTYLVGDGHIDKFDCVPSTLEEFEDQNKIKVGDWVRYSDTQWGKVTEIRDDMLDWLQPCNKNNIDSKGHKKGLGTNGCNKIHVKKISDEEVLELFKKEAVRRGLIPGAEYMSPNGAHKRIVYKEYIFSPIWIGPNIACLQDGVYCIWTENNGWGTVIKDEPIKIGSYEVRFDTHTISIDGNIYSPGDLEKVRLILNMNKVHSLNVGCTGQYELTLDVVEQIISRLK